MDIHKLEIFLDLAQTGNYSETAERLYTTQSTISKQIQALEKELGCELFDRSKRKISLTHAGSSILPEVREMVNLSLRLRQKAIRASQYAKQTLSIHAIPVLHHYRIPSLLKEFRKENPDIRVHLEEAEASVLTEHLLKDKCDLIFARFLQDAPPKCEYLTLEDDHFVAVLPESHPLAQKKTVSLKDLKDEAFVLPEEQTNLLQEVRNMCRKEGFDPQIEYKGLRVDMLLSMVKAGVGVAILMDKTVNVGEGIVKIPLDEFRKSRLVFCRKHDNARSKEEERFWDFLIKHGCKY